MKIQARMSKLLAAGLAAAVSLALAGGIADAAGQTGPGTVTQSAFASWAQLFERRFSSPLIVQGGWSPAPISQLVANYAAGAGQLAQAGPADASWAQLGFHSSPCIHAADPAQAAGSAPSTIGSAAYISPSSFFEGQWQQISDWQVGAPTGWQSWIVQQAGYHRGWQTSPQASWQTWTAQQPDYHLGPLASDVIAPATEGGVLGPNYVPWNRIVFGSDSGQPTSATQTDGQIAAWAAIAQAAASQADITTSSQKASAGSDPVVVDQPTSDSISPSKTDTGQISARSAYDFWPGAAGQQYSTNS